MENHNILAVEEALDVERAFRAELDNITNDDRPGYYYEQQRETFDALAAESPTGYLCSGCQAPATHYAPSAFFILSQAAPDYRYPWCLNCRDLVLLTAHEALARMGSTQDYDDFAEDYLCEKAVETMLAGPLTQRALDTFHDESNYHRLIKVVVAGSFECDIAGCTRMAAITLCPQHAQNKHQKAVAEQQQKAVRADRVAAATTLGLPLATISLPLWLIPDPLVAALITGLATLTALFALGDLWWIATDKHRDTPNPMNSL